MSLILKEVEVLLLKYIHHINLIDIKIPRPIHLQNSPEIGWKWKWKTRKRNTIFHGKCA